MSGAFCRLVCQLYSSEYDFEVNLLARSRFDRIGDSLSMISEAHRAAILGGDGITSMHQCQHLYMVVSVFATLNYVYKFMHKQIRSMSQDHRHSTEIVRRLQKNLRFPPYHLF